MNGIDFNWLEEHIFRRKLAMSERAAIEQLITIHHFAAGEQVRLETRGVEGRIYIIRSGSVKLFIDLGNEMSHSTCMSEGAQIGDLAFLDSEAHILVEIIEDSVAYNINRATLANLLIFTSEMNLKALWPQPRALPGFGNSGEISRGSIPLFPDNS